MLLKILKKDIREIAFNQLTEDNKKKVN